MARFLGKDVHTSFEVTALEPGRSITISSLPGSSFPIRITREVEPLDPERTRVRETADRTWRKVTGQQTDLIRYDDEEDLTSLLPNPDVQRPSGEEESWPDTFAELGESVSADATSTTERPLGS